MHIEFYRTQNGNRNQYIIITHEPDSEIRFAIRVDNTENREQMDNLLENMVNCWNEHNSDMH